ncbi:MAG TPA: hypothetical protein DDZ91_11915 [Firmicutes bacterium]|jgi:hypothetical protein|nr:hypothetical protein [Bacillota bacterium]
MLFLVGQNLAQKNSTLVFLKSLWAGLGEELSIRMPTLILFSASIIDQLYLPLGLLIVFSLLVNSMWTVGHLGNVPKSVKHKQSFSSTIRLAMPHMIVIFLSGIPFYIISLKLQSILPVIIAHFLTRFYYGPLHTI